MRFYLPLTRHSRVSVGCLGMTLIAVVYAIWVPLMVMLWLTINALILAVRLIAGLATLAGDQYRARQARKATPSPGK